MKANDTIFVLLTAAALLVAAPSAFADVQPGTTPTATRQSIQAAIDAAAAQSPAGTVTLGAGTFEIDAQLMVTNGVTLQGQGWDSTIIKQTSTPGANTRVVTIDDGSTVAHVTLTGGRTSATWASGSGAGAYVKNGTISWCRVSGNATGVGTATANNLYGAAVSFYEGKGRIDHSIIDSNEGGSRSGYCHGGGIGIYNPSGAITIDASLVFGNSATGDGGGIYASFGNYHNLLTVRNSTIAGNESSGTGGGVYTAEYYAANKFSFAFVNSLLADNVSGSEGADPNLTLPSDNRIVSGYAAKSSNNLFANGTAALGTQSQSVSGSGEAWFVDAANGDYHLTATSPAIDAGATYEGIGVDLDNVAFANPPAVGCYEYGERVADPEFAPAPGSTFYPTASVTLSCATEGASIHYTTDGSVPTDSGAAYSGPIALSATTTIKARAYAPGKGPSAIVSATYTLKRPVPKPSAFKKSVEITLATDALAGIPSGVPALVRLDESGIVGFDYGDFTLPNGGDLMFFDENGTPLPHEVDTWDENGKSLVWVKLASTAENTKIFMYYGNGTVSSEEPEDVWTDYVGVWHFEEATAATTAYSYGTYANSTATSGVGGNIAEHTVTNETGRFGKCFRVNDSTGKGLGNFNCGGVWVADSGTGSPVDGGQSFTISGWFKHGNFDYSWDHLFYKREKSDNSTDKSPHKDAFAIECNVSSGKTPNPYARGSSNTGGHKGLSNNLVDQWGYLTFVYSGNACYLYENGGSLGWVTIAACIDNDSPLVFGNNCNVASGLIGDSAWNGWIDEVRYSAGSKSAAWVAAEYAAMNVSATDIFAYGAAQNAKSSGAGAVIFVQ